MNAKQKRQLREAIEAQQMYVASEKVLRGRVQVAREIGIPILYLADALGVSRSRIRVLSRPAREHQQ